MVSWPGRRLLKRSCERIKVCNYAEYGQEHRNWDRKSRECPGSEVGHPMFASRSANHGKFCCCNRSNYEKVHLPNYSRMRILTLLQLNNSRYHEQMIRRCAVGVNSSIRVQDLPSISSKACGFEFVEPNIPHNFAYQINS